MKQNKKRKQTVKSVQYGLEITLKYQMKTFRKNAIFEKVEDLKPLNTCKEPFEMIWPSMPLDDCEIQGEYMVG